MVICNYMQCTGCCACMNICSKNAISMITDQYGNSIPKVDNSKCVSCGLCQKICPINAPAVKRMPQKAYAVWSHNDKDKEHSSSGGIAAVISRNIISNEGVVFGCASIDGDVKHISAHTIKDTDLLRGSKYVQSNTGLIYREVKSALDKDRNVLFIGVPCQIAALYAYLRKDYKKLYTIDLICHGTPPKQFLDEHISASINNKEWDSISFRGQYDWKLTVWKNGKFIYQRDRHSDMYFRAFLDALIYRENCYSCPYSCPERCGDLTIGDFWGLDKSTLNSSYDGNISLVLTNTIKGRDMLFDNASQLYIQERSIQEAMNKQQTNLLHPSVAPIDREKFLSMYPMVGFDKAVKCTTIGKEVERTYRNCRLNNSLCGKAYKFVKRAICFIYRKMN